MISVAVSLACVTFAGFFILYKKLPQKVKDFITAHSLIFDAAAATATYAFLGGTVSALIAGGLVALFTSAALHIANHREDFLYLEDGLAMAKSAWAGITQKLNEAGKNYRQHRLGETRESSNI